MGNRFLDAVNNIQENILKFNPYHAKDGRFTSGEGANSYSWRDGRHYSRAEEDEAFKVQEVKMMLEKGVTTPDEAIAVGTKIQELMGEDYHKFVEGYVNQTTLIEGQLRRMRPEVEQKVKEAQALRDQNMFNEAVKDYNNLVTKKRELLGVASVVMQNKVTETLKQFTPMGGEIKSIMPNSHPNAVIAMQVAAKLYPKSWGEMNSTGMLTMTMASRGYTRGTFEIALSGQTPACRIQTAVHEMAHRTSMFSGRVNVLECAYYAQRTAGERTISMNKAMGTLNYRADERTKVDNFASAYTGKVYKDKNSKYGVDATEILSTGIEALFYPTKVSMDKEQAAFCLGVMAGVK